jgi:hypothetical protein
VKLFNLALACAVSVASLAFPLQGHAQDRNEALPQFDNTLYCVAPATDGKGVSLYSLGAYRMLTAHSGQRCNASIYQNGPALWGDLISIP